MTEPEKIKEVLKEEKENVVREFLHIVAFLGDMALLVGLICRLRLYF